MHQPANVGGELLCLRPWQHHAIVERMQKPCVGYPAFSFHQILMHDGDLPGGAAEADEAEFQPVPEGFGKTHHGWLGTRGDLAGGFGHGGAFTMKRVEV